MSAESNKVTPISAGRGLRKTNPPIRLGYTQLGNPQDVEASTLRRQPVAKELANETTSAGASMLNRSRHTPKSVISTHSSVSARLKENDLLADRKSAELDKQLQSCKEERKVAEMALAKVQAKYEKLLEWNTDGEWTKEIQKLELEMIDLDADLQIKTAQVLSLESSVNQDKKIIIKEKELNHQIILEESTGSLGSLDEEQKKHGVEDWLMGQEFQEKSSEDDKQEASSEKTKSTGAGSQDKDMVSHLVTALGQAFGNSGQRQTVVTKQVDKELPFFSGKPEEWLTFKSEFERTTAKYHYEDSENAVRLRKFIKGPAKDAISHLLANPNNVSKVIQLLENRFGNPKYVLGSLIEKAKLLKPPDLNKPDTIIDFGTAVDVLVTNIIAFNKLEYINNIQLLSKLVEKLPPVLRREWYHWIGVQTQQKEDLEGFQKWLECEVNTAIRSVKPSSLEEKPERGRRHGFHNAQEDKEELCVCCFKGKHPLASCFKFKKQDTAERWKLVRDQKLCFQCLQKGHRSSDCSKSRPCELDGCTKTHHRLLHGKTVERERNPDPIDRDPQEDNREENEHVIGTAGEGHLPIIPVKITGPRGTKRIYALLDIGASFTSMESSVAEELGLVGKASPFRFRVFNNKVQYEKDSQIVACKIASNSSRRNDKKFDLKRVRTVKSLGIPGSSLDFEKLKLKYPYLRRAKACCIPDVKPQMVIGFDYYRLYHSRSVVEGPDDSTPIALWSRLGWYVCIGNAGKSCFYACETRTNKQDEEINDDMKNFTVSVPPARSKDDQRGLEILDKNTREIDGSWEAPLLWKEENPCPPESKSMALRRLRIMELEADNSIRIPRRMSRHEDAHVDLNCFVDASEEAYSCAVYFRFESTHGAEQCFVAGRARMEPLKGLIIPRVELEAALIGSRLAETVRKTFDGVVNIRRATFWSDSKTALCWFRSQSGCFKMVVQTRVGEILETTNAHDWRWVPTKQNVADDATRFNSTSLSNESRWIFGVEFLLEPMEIWPTEAKKTDEVEADADGNAAFTTKLINDSLPEISRFAPWMRQIRATDAVFYAARRCKNEGESYITVEDMDKAELSWIRCGQEDSFGQEMRALPVCRLGESRQIFFYAGTDVFGPLQVKVKRQTGNLRGVNFTCMSTRAVHFDLLAGLDGNEMILAILRFTALRGKPNHLWSDNGTNYVRANKEIQSAVKSWNEDVIQRTLAIKGIEWHFNPPAAPHMGGSWERLIGSAKRIMVTLLKGQVPTKSFLTTVMVEVIEIINSRPIMHASADPDDSECLTPNHLLRLNGSGGQTLPGVYDSKDKFHRKWKYAEFLADEFWRRWTAEYLPNLVKREKWTKETSNLKIGDVVFVVDDLVPRSAWKKGIVEATFPGKDGKVRVVEVRVSLGKAVGKENITFTKLRRPVVKVVPLGLNCLVTQDHWEGGNVADAPADNHRV